MKLSVLIVTLLLFVVSCAHHGNNSCQHGKKAKCDLLKQKQCPHRNNG